MKRLILIRHAKSSWKDMTLSDFDRPLNKRGILNGDFMSDKLSKKIKSVDALFSSSSKRTILTSNFFINKINVDKDRIYYMDNLYHANENYLIDFVSSLKNSFSSVICLGHNPGFTDVSNYFLGNTFYNVPTCGIVIIDFKLEKWEGVGKKKGKFTHKMFPKDYS